MLVQLILLIGNYMNGTGVKGGAFGFRVSSINKVWPLEPPVDVGDSSAGASWSTRSHCTTRLYCTS